jgi:hypothetical protein
MPNITCAERQYAIAKEELNALKFMNAPLMQQLCLIKDNTSVNVYC